MVKVRAKVQCYSIKESHYDTYKVEDGKTVVTSTLSWSYEFKFAGGHESAENEKFWSASPSGTLTLQALRNNLYEVGQWYYLDWTPTTVDGSA